MSAYAVPAQILLHLEQHAGEWISLRTLNDRLILSSEQIRLAANQLVASGAIAFAEVSGTPYYGKRVEGVPPPHPGSSLPPVDRVALAKAQAELGDAIRAVLTQLHVGMHAIAMRNDDALLLALRQAFRDMPALEVPLRKYALLIQPSAEPITNVLPITTVPY